MHYYTRTVALEVIDLLDEPVTKKNCSNLYRTVNKWYFDEIPLQIWLRLYDWKRIFKENMLIGARASDKKMILRFKNLQTLLHLIVLDLLKTGEESKVKVRETVMVR